jgi:hypothetical protein
VTINAVEPIAAIDAIVAEIAEEDVIPSETIDDIKGVRSSDCVGVVCSVECGL